MALPGSVGPDYDAPPASEALGADTVPRFIIVRDPYARALSGFLDKMFAGTGLYRKQFGMAEKPSRDAAGFQVFLDALEAKLKAKPKNVDQHFAPQSSMGKRPYQNVSSCFIQEGYQYDFILKLEEMSEWMADFIVMNGLVERTRTGWGKDEMLSDNVSESDALIPPVANDEIVLSEPSEDGCIFNRRGKVLKPHAFTPHLGRPASSFTRKTYQGPVVINNPNHSQFLRQVHLRLCVSSTPLTRCCSK